MVETLHLKKQLYRPTLSLWSTAVAFSLALHFGGALLFLRNSPMTTADNPPSAIMMEVAFEPEAIQTENNEISLDQQSADFSAQQTNQPVEIQVESQIIDNLPLEQSIEDTAVVEFSETITPEPEITSLDELVTAQLEKAEVPLPAARHRLALNKETLDKKPIRKPQRQIAATASQAKIQAQAQVIQANRNAARQASSGVSSSSITPAKWLSRLMAHLEKRKKYPRGARARGEIGTAYVRFRIDAAGNVLSSSLAGSSGFPELDNEVLAMVRRASPVPVPPIEANKTITAPIKFSVE